MQPSIFKYYFVKNAHKNVHSKVTVECKYCKKQFVSKDYLKKHIAFIHETRIFVCGICKGESKSRDALYKHMKTHSKKTNEEENGNLDLVSNFSIEEKEYLTNGAIKPKQEKKSKTLSSLTIKYTCGICGVIYASKSGLADHVIQEHEDQSP